jgi:hypothetical protein
LAGKNATAVFTIRDAPHVPDPVKVEYLVESGESEAVAHKAIFEMGWPTGTTARREYFCEFVTDASSAVIPEFTKEREQAMTRTWPLPDYYDSYVAMDPGFNDRTGILFAYWDFRNARLVIQDEALLDQANTQAIAATIAAKEGALWGRKKPYLRISDVDLRLIADLQAMHSLTFSPTRKEDSLGAVNLMRNMVQSAQIIIDPKCQNLLRQMRNATWNSKATDFARGSRDEGHYDLVAALKYLCRNVVKEKSPFPDWYFLPGAPGGPPSGTYISHKRAKPRSRGLYTDTPLANKLVKKDNK